MKKITEITLILVLSLTFFACSEDEPQIINKTLTLKFENTSNTSNKGESTYTTYEVEIISMSPFQINSNQLEVKKIINPETSKPTYLILEIENNSTKSKSSQSAKVTSRRGFMYDGNDCWIAGTWYEDDVSGVSLFYPASLTAQVISNVCGWSNLA